MNTLLLIVITLVTAILSYFVIGWLTVWFYYAVASILIYVTKDNKYSIDPNNIENIFWAWPIILPFALLMTVFHIPYVTLLKFTPRSPT